MAEVITAIEKIEGVQLHEEYKYRWYDGFKITTTDQEIYFGINNGQDCCEDWGYFLSEDDVQQFIGAELFTVDVTDTALRVYEVHEYLKLGADNSDLDSGGVMFVNLKTNKGVLQFVAYNAHNGYYGHDAVVISKQITHTEDL